MSNIIDSVEAIPAPGTAIPIEEIPENMRGFKLSPQEIENLKSLLVNEIKADTTVQLAPKRKIVKDFSNLTQDSIYDPDIHMEAKAFMSGDPLKVVLKDTNYEPRWVSKNSQRLGHMKTIGFTYATMEDIDGSLEVDLDTDSNGHISFHDVVLMRVPKASYYPAMRAAHERAQRLVSHNRAAKNGQAVATNFMATESGSAIASDYAEASENGKLQFYSANS